MAKAMWNKMIPFLVTAGILGHHGISASYTEKEGDQAIHGVYEEHIHVETPQYDSSLHQIEAYDTSATVITWRSTITPFQRWPEGDELK